jgi:hypothetical protein
MIDDDHPREVSAMADAHDFFISFTATDEAWARWIARTLEEAGYSCTLQAWDFAPGTSFVLQMQQEAERCDRTIAVLSEGYLRSTDAASEWAAAFLMAPKGRTRKLVPVRVAECQPKGLLQAIVYIDVVGLAEAKARAALLGGFGPRQPPAGVPASPGAPPRHVPSHPAPFPGPTSTEPYPLLTPPSASRPPGPAGAGLSHSERLALRRTLGGLPPRQLNVLLFVLSPPAGAVPPMPAPPAERTDALLGWAERAGGCGLVQVKQVLEGLFGPP